ncbi:response regulator [Bacteroidaceae bacterium HV4-6-C5C]|nr:response regulator [Bacteroidaceae bacterium HV4-6-C5C]
MTKHLLLLLLLMMQFMGLSADTFRHLSIREGLSSRQVYQIHQDSSGFIWAYTHVGVDRYDGNEIKHYKLDQAVDSKDHILSSTTMACDRHGIIWIGLKNGKIYAYNKQTDSFQLKIDLGKQFPSPVLNSFLFDQDNRLWLCMSTGLYYWDIASNKVALAGLQNKYVNCIVQSTDNVFYAGTDAHVYLIKRDRRSSLFFKNAVTLPIDVRVESLFIFRHKLYIGSFSNGVFIQDILTGSVGNLNHFLPNLPVRGFASTKSNTVLIGVDGAGVFRINADNAKFMNHYVADEDDEGSLGGNTVSDVCVDQHDWVWVSTSSNGVSFLDPKRSDIKWVAHKPNDNNSLLSNHVNVILEDSEGDYWYGTNDGVSLFRRKLNKWTHFLNNKGKTAGAGSSVVLALCEDSKGGIWVGGYGIGVYCINKRSGNIEKIAKRSKSIKSGVSTDYVYSIYAEGDNVWLGGIEGSLTRYNISTRSYAYYPVECIGDLTPGNNGELLIAGCNGLGFLNRITGKVRWVHQFGSFNLSYPVRCLIQARNGDIWMATDGDGLIQFNPHTKQSRVYSTKDGLASNSISSVVQDKLGHIWFATEKELYSLNSATGFIMRMNDLFDIKWGYYNPGAVQKLKDGNLAFGTAEGAVIINPLSNFGREGRVTLIFTDFKLLYNSVKAGEKGSLLKSSIDDTDKIELQYAQNSFSISYSAINFTSPHRIRYEYQLENFKDQWEQASSIGSVSYTNLSPGKYIFKLYAFDKYTQRKIGEKSIQITIHQPLWLSGWAIFFYCLLLGGFTYLFVEYRKHQQRENRANEKIRSFISFAHDIRTPVTLIKAPLTELQMQDSLSEENKKTVAVAVKNVEKLYGMVTQLLNLQRNDVCSDVLRVSYYNVKNYMEEIVADFRMAAIQKGIDIKLEVASDILELCFDKDKMDHIMNNLLSNALKYTENGSISVSIRRSRKRWFIEVEDTGVGIPDAEQSNIFHEYYRAKNVSDSEESGLGIGLMITRRMIKQHQGSISFKSAENRGTVFVISFPVKLKSCVLVDSHNESAGVDIVTSKNDISTHKNLLLLAEDDKDMREYLSDSLSGEYQVVSVADGGKALESAKELNPDIIISDVIMPVLQGDELCRILKSSVETSHIPVILLTALSERENIILGLESGANDYIIKPFDLSVLKVRLRNILQSRQHLRDAVLSEGMGLDEMDYSSQLDKEFVDKAMAMIDAELANPEFSINDFCRMLGMSRTSVYNKIKTLTGQGPNDFIRIIRLNKSKELLLSRKYSIAEVSSMVGFSDPKYFSTSFKKQFGTSPSKI